MSFLLLGAIGQAIVKLLLGAVAVFLILLVLVQRGRGGGLAGAFGGMGGSSAFGAKAGDVFTRITIVAAAIWIVLCMIAANLTPEAGSRLDTGGIGAGAQAPIESGPAMTGPAEDDAEEGEDSQEENTEVDEVFEEESSSEESGAGEPTEDASTEP